MLNFLKQKNENKRYHGIHITHNDADAVGCALVLSYLRPEYDYHKNTYFCSIGTQDNKVINIIEKIKSGEEEMPISFVISDLSLSEKTCALLEDFCLDNGIELFGFDHHVTNNLYEEYPWWFVSKEPVKRDGLEEPVEISATLVIYNHFTKYDIYSESVLKIANLISDYDTWTWRKYPNLYKEETVSPDIVGIVCSLLRPEKMYKALYEYYCDGKIRYKTLMFPDLFYTLYDIEVENRERYLKSVHYKTKVFTHNRFSYGLVICENQYYNAVAEHLYNNYPLDIIIMIYPTSKKIGLRTKRTDINLGDIAKKYYHGGGHQAAAGGVMEDDVEFMSLLKVYYIDSVPLVDYMNSLQEKEKE